MRGKSLCNQVYLLQSKFNGNFKVDVLLWAHQLQHAQESSMNPTTTEPPELEEIHEDHQVQLQVQISPLVPFVCCLQFALPCHTLQTRLWGLAEVSLVQLDVQIYSVIRHKLAVTTPASSFWCLCWLIISSECTLNYTKIFVVPFLVCQMGFLQCKANVPKPQ